MKLYYKDEYTKLIQGDCLEVMDKMIEKGIKFDAIITDPPYGTTACKWDSVIPLDKMWDRLNKLIKQNCSCLLFGSEPFSTKLRNSNFDNYRYDWYWIKSKAGLFQHAKNRPMKAVENIIVFSKSKWGHSSQLKENRMLYYPQGIKSVGEKVVTEGYNSKNLTNGGRPNQVGKKYEAFTGFPNDVLNYDSIFGKGTLHPTQKPVDLMEYLINTYTKENDLILDFTCGSGSTLKAAKNLKRKCIGIEKEGKYCEITKERLSK